VLGCRTRPRRGEQRSLNAAQPLKLPCVSRNVGGQHCAHEILWLLVLDDGVKQLFVKRGVCAVSDRKTVEELLCCGRKRAGWFGGLGSLCDTDPSAMSQGGAAGATPEWRVGFCFVPR
jgi:hypothetical protein